MVLFADQCRRGQGSMTSSRAHAINKGGNMKTEKKGIVKLHRSRIGALMPALLAVLLLPSAGCGEKTPTPTTESAQQQPLKQKIAELLEKAEAGDAEAQASLAESYAAGDGLPKDSTKAADLFQKAAAKGIARAQYRLSQMYSKGEAVPQDSAKAVDLLRQSASNGYAKAQAALAAMYAKGENVMRDDVLAYAWATLAMRQGEEQGKEVHDSVKLTALLRDEGERLAAGWRRGVALVRQRTGTDQQGKQADTGA